jgi:predicted CxxxxCH...CXXCH cytochrome family protein
MQRKLVMHSCGFAAQWSCSCIQEVVGLQVLASLRGGANTFLLLDGQAGWMDGGTVRCSGISCHSGWAGIDNVVVLTWNEVGASVRHGHGLACTGLDWIGRV